MRVGKRHCPARILARSPPCKYPGERCELEFMSIDRLVRPTFAEARSTALQEGFLFGLIPGVVTNVDDPEKIGRVQVECPLIEANVNLPNGDDGWIPVIESFVVNSSTGGSHSFIQTGSQVVMACLFGDPRQFVVIGCVPSRVDRPHPDLNRAAGTYGSVTPNETIEIFNDRDNSAVVMRPNGLMQSISGDGDWLVQTLNQGRIQIQHSGDVRLENNFSYMRISDRGEVSQQSRAGAIAILRETGEVALQSSQSARLQLDGAEGLLEGPLNNIGQLGQVIRSSLGGVLGQAQEALEELQSITQSGGEPLAVLNSAATILANLGVMATSIREGGKAIEQLGNDFSVEQLGRSLMPQVNAMTGINGIIPGVLPLIVPQASGLMIAQQVAAILPDELREKFSVDLFGPVLDRLRGQADQQLQVVLGAIAPGGFSAIQNIVGLNIHTILGDLLRAVEAFQSIARVEILDSLVEEALSLVVSEIRNLLPDTIGKFLPDSMLRSIIGGEGSSVGQSIEKLLGSVVSGIAQEAGQKVSEIGDGFRVIQGVAELAATIQVGTGSNDARSALRQVLPNFADQGLNDIQALQAASYALAHQIIPLINSGMASVNQLINAVPAVAGSRVRATPDYIQMETYLGGVGATARITELSATLLSPSGINQIFAGIGGAGIRTPFGRFSFGSSGGGIFSQGAIALRALQDIGNTVGLLLHPQEGISISSFRGAGGYHDDEESIEWRDELARVVVKDDAVFIEALDSTQQVMHQVRISTDGVFIDGVNVSRFADMEERLNLLTARVAALEAP